MVVNQLVRSWETLSHRRSALADPLCHRRTELGDKSGQLLRRSIGHAVHKRTTGGQDPLSPGPRRAQNPTELKPPEPAVRRGRDPGIR